MANVVPHEHRAFTPRPALPTAFPAAAAAGFAGDAGGTGRTTWETRMVRRLVSKLTVKSIGVPQRGHGMHRSFVMGSMLMRAPHAQENSLGSGPATCPMPILYTFLGHRGR